MPSLLFWVFFLTLLFAYTMGILSVLLYHHLNLRWITRHTRQREQDEDNEGYTLTIVQRPQSDDEGA